MGLKDLSWCTNSHHTRGPSAIHTTQTNTEQQTLLTLFTGKWQNSIVHALVKVEILAPKYFTESSKQRIQTESYIQQVSFILEMITFHTYTMTNTAMMTKVAMTTILLQS